ncbi:MAG: hypothetical protein ABIJ08_02835 [Nanoarchaeota archaeon]
MHQISRLKKTILGIAIALVLAFFLGYALNTIYPPLRYDNFCQNITARIDVESCADYKAPVKEENMISYPEQDCFCRQIDEKGTMKCDTMNPEYTECMKEYDAKRETHGRNSFVILVILGLAAILIGGLALKVESVSSGIMGGGVLTLLYSAIRFWGDIEDYARLIILGVTLFVLIWIGYKKFKE